MLNVCFFVWTCGWDIWHGSNERLVYDLHAAFMLRDLGVMDFRSRRALYLSI